MPPKLTYLLVILILTVPVVTAKAQITNSTATRSSEPFKVTRDSVQMSIEGRLEHALLIENKYYAFYQIRDSMSSQPIRKFYIIKKNGEVEKEVKLPQGLLKDTYPKMYYWQGRIWVITEFYKGNYLLQEDKGRFEQIPGEILKIPIFDGESTAVTSECRGEFGSTIYFKNKHTGTIYSDHSGCPIIINKLGDKYLVNVSSMPYSLLILEIKDPVLANTGAMPSEKIIFKNDDFNSHFYVPTSFLIDSTLYLICNYNHNDFRLDEKKERTVVTKDSVKIATIGDGVFRPVYTFKDRFHIQFEQQLTPNYQICTFHTEDRIQIGFKADHPPYMEGKYGVIEIAGNEIKIHYFVSKRQE